MFENHTDMLYNNRCSGLATKQQEIKENLQFTLDEYKREHFNGIGLDDEQQTELYSILTEQETDHDSFLKSLGEQNTDLYLFLATYLGRGR